MTYSLTISTAARSASVRIAGDVDRRPCRGRITTTRSAVRHVDLHLDHRSQFTDRVLQVTGLFEHFDLTRSDAETGDPGLLGQAGRANQAAR
jgi:hypothetical protein